MGSTVLDITAVAFNTAEVLAVWAMGLAAYAVIWGLKKAISIAR